MGEFDSTTYSLSNDGRNASVAMSAVENVPETKSPFKSGLLAPPSGLGLRVPSPLPLSFGKYPQEELRSAGGANRLLIAGIPSTDLVKLFSIYQSKQLRCKITLEWD